MTWCPGLVPGHLDRGGDRRRDARAQRAELPVPAGLGEREELLVAAWLASLRAARTRRAYAGRSPMSTLTPGTAFSGSGCTTKAAVYQTVQVRPVGAAQVGVELPAEARPHAGAVAGPAGPVRAAGAAPDTGPYGDAAHR